MQDDNNKKRDEIAQMLRESVVPRPQGGNVTIQKLVIVLPPGEGLEFLTALRQVLKDE